MLIGTQLLVKDRGGNVSRTSAFWEVSDSLAISGAVGLLNSYAALVQAVSDGIVISGRLVLPDIEGSNFGADLFSDVYSSLVCFCLSNSGRAGYIQIPSPRQDLFDIGGDFIGFRVLEQIAILQEALDFTQSGTLELVDEAGVSIQGPLVVAARRYGI
jgi:hypothetical protein